MRLALGLLFTNELDYLKLHLSAYAAEFDGIVGITDPRTTDGSLDYLQDAWNADVLVRDWTYDWGAFATQLCNYAEDKGYDAIMRMDPDECLMPYAATLIKFHLQREASLLCFPRHEFFGDRAHVRPDLYPDHQARAWRLHRGIRVQGKRHEGIDFAAHGLSEHSTDPEMHVLRLTDPYLHIFHYGWIGKQGIRRNQVKYQRHAQVEAGGPEHVALSEDTPPVSFPTLPFDGPQPIDLKYVHLTAPYEE